MKKANIFVRSHGGAIECRIEMPSGRKALLTGLPEDIEPVVDDPDIGQYRALISNAWACAQFSQLAATLPTQDEQDAARERSEQHRSVAVWIAGLADEPVGIVRTGWCSDCCQLGEHQKVKRSVKRTPTFLCRTCGTPTSACAAKNCDNMAIRREGSVRVPRFCAEHRHEIPGFEKAASKMESLADYGEFLEYKQRNLARVSKVAGMGATALAIGATGGIVLAPAIGGSIGTLVGGYTGAAATNFGLALLGGGSVASGGLGMAGGTAVVAAAGGALGGTVGASVMTAYVREDKSFSIERLQDGDGVPVVVCNGFLTEGGNGWAEWQTMIGDRYPDSPIFRVHWGSKELKALGILATRSSLQTAAASAVKQAAASATKTGSRSLGPVGPALLAAELIKNPWHVARSRANKTGVAVADLIARTQSDSYVLIGHSLGARAMCIAAQSLATKSNAPRLDSVHLLGAAINADFDVESLTRGVDRGVFNYYSTNDNVLKYVYRAAQGGRTAAGLGGFASNVPGIENVDVSGDVSGHSQYHAHVQLR